MGEGEKADGGTILDAFLAWGFNICIGCLGMWLFGYELSATNILCVAIVGILILPPSLDSAIKIKEYAQKGRGQ